MTLSPFAKYPRREPVGESEDVFASEACLPARQGFRSRRSIGRRYLDREVEGASLQCGGGLGKEVAAGFRHELIYTALRVVSLNVDTSCCNTLSLVQIDLISFSIEPLDV